MTNSKQKAKYYIPIIILLVIASIFYSHNASSQVVPVPKDTPWVSTDTAATVIVSKDSINGSKARAHSPRKAALFSAILPGAGQVYNHKYWKVPIIYGLAATAGSLIYYNYTIYIHLHNGYITRITNPTQTLQGFSVLTITGKLNIDLDQFQASDLLSLQDSYRRDLDLSVIFAVGVYGLNIIDALVDAHLFNFDVSDKLTLHVQPQYTPIGGFTHSGFGLNLNMQF